MIALGIAAFVLAALAAVVTNVGYAFFGTTTIWGATYSGRLLRWIAWTGIPLTLLGLLIFGAEVIGGRKVTDSWGAKIALWGFSWLVGGWTLGAASSYVLQYLAGWKWMSAAEMAIAAQAGGVGKVVSSADLIKKGAEIMGKA